MTVAAPIFTKLAIDRDFCKLLCQNKKQHRRWQQVTETTSGHMDVVWIHKFLVVQRK
jgi:hypothetical protein